ncbi:MAG: OPT family oligopeptide transporter [Candidatus Rokubacteria bacterium]|nr:OPT family oligopeptide transporter [Candidatus Rokubacteria bacterium]
MAQPESASPTNVPASPTALPVEGFRGTPEEIERQWYEQVYRGRGDSMLQLTWRAVLMGSVLGGALSLTNLYIGLKAGWGFGVAITACILSYAIWTTLHRVGIVREPMTILENNCMQSTASSAGYSTGGTLISAFAAYMLINNSTMSLPTMLAWVFCLSVLGVTMAIPMKRQMINVEQLRFPSGIAAAETLRALHSVGESGMRSARALGWAGLLAVVSKFWTEGLVVVSAQLAPFMIGTWVAALNQRVFGPAWMGRTVMFSWEPMFIAAGAITGLHVCWSMFLGSVTAWMIFAPVLQHRGIIEGSGYATIVQWTLWGGVACMVTSSLLSFGLQWRTALRAFTDLRAMFGGGRGAANDPVGAIETPASWFITGQVIGFLGLAWLGHRTFGMPYWQTAVAVALSFALALVACRVTGETDTTPVGAMGKITQLTFGALSPGHMNINLMSANITAAAAGSSADLLTDLKSGYLLGAHPRKQFIAQFAGIFVGTLVSVLCFRLLVPDASALGTDQFPAPAAQTWRAVAVALSEGLGALGPVKIWSIVIGGLVGIVLTLLPRIFPTRRHLIPSPAGVGLAWTFHWHYGLLFFIGGVLGWWVQKKHPKWSEELTFPVASGWIAGESLMGVGLVMWENGPELVRKLFGR